MDVVQRPNGTWSLDWQKRVGNPDGPYITLTTSQFWDLLRELRKMRLAPGAPDE